MARVAGEGKEEFALTPAGFEVLLALVDRDRHGYGIMKEIRRQGADPVGPGSLYGILGRLESAGLVEESKEERPDPELDDERRRYFRITEGGKKLLAQETRKLEETIGRARAKGLTPQAAPGPEKRP